MKMLHTKLRSLIFPAMFTATFSRSECENERGLLCGIQDFGAAKDYSRSMIIKDAAALLNDTGYIYRCALMDAKGNVQECEKNIANIVENARKFRASKEVVWDREELQATLNEVITDEGRFVCFLGGKSTGKSLILEKLQMDNKDSVFLLDLRRSSDISLVLQTVLEERRKILTEDENLLLNSVKEGIALTATAVKQKVAVGFLKGLTSGITAILENDKAKKSLEVLIAEIIKLKEDGNVTFIVDEANIAFTITPWKTAESIEKVKAVLALFTRLTKQNGKVRFFLNVLKI